VEVCAKFGGNWSSSSGVKRGHRYKWSLLYRDWQNATQNRTRGISWIKEQFLKMVDLIKVNQERYLSPLLDPWPPNPWACDGRNAKPARKLTELEVFFSARTWPLSLNTNLSNGEKKFVQKLRDIYMVKTIIFAIIKFLFSSFLLKSNI